MQGLIQRITGSRPVRAFFHYGERKGIIFAQGMTLSAFFSLFAALFIGFAIFALVLGDNAVLRDRVVDAIAGSVPGLIDTGDGTGVLNVDDLIGSSVIGWGTAIASVGILVTAIGWIGMSRDGFRVVFGLPDLRTNIVLLRLGDLGVAFGIGLLVLTSAGVLVVTSAIADSLGIGGVGLVIGIVAQLALDTAVVALLFRFAGRLRLPPKQLFGAAFACAIAFAVLKQLASLLLSGGSNPLIASFAAIIGILLWLGFVNQILLLALSFIAVGQVGVAYTRLEDVEVAQEQRIAQAREERKALIEERRNRADPDDMKQGLITRQLHKRLAKRARRR